MRSYYYHGITCPDCHEPHVSGQAIETINEKTFRCISCGAKFHKYIDVQSSDLFPKTINHVISKEGENAANYLSNLPLLWKIEPNIIEQEYIDFFSTEKKGFYFITWPWRDVRFLPLMVFEYLLTNPDKKAVVIGNYTCDDNTEVELFPSSPLVFNNLSFLKDIEEIDRDVRREIRKFSDKLVFEKEKVVEIKYRNIGSNDLIPSRLCYHTLRKCKNKILNEDSEFGDSLLRNISEHKLGRDPVVETINEKGAWDVSLYEQERWTGSLQYNKLWLWEVLFNSTNLFACKSLVRSHFYREIADDNYNSSSHRNIRLNFLPSEPYLDKTLDLVEELSPDILIIENMDEIISDSRFGGERSKVLLNFLHNHSVKTIIMFSTDPDMRQFYKIHDDETIFQDIDVIVHTWDSQHILNNLPAGNESKYPNPVSSGTNQIICENMERINPEYLILDSYNSATENIDKYLLNLSIDHRNDLIFYFNRLFSTPLNLQGDYSDSEILMVKRKGDNYLTYENVMSRLYMLVDQNAFQSINSTLNEIFQLNSLEQTNPLRDKILSFTKTILESAEDWYFTVVVLSYEVKGTELLFKKAESTEDSLFTYISFCDWNNLKAHENNVPDGYKHCIISTCYPSLNYRLNLSNADRLVFIGNEKTIGNIKYIIEKRLLEINAYPLIKPDADVYCPDLLHELFNLVDIPDKEQFTRVTESLIEDAKFIMPYSETVSSERIAGTSDDFTTHLKINTGEAAILCTDAQNRGLFLPLNSNILIRTNETLQEFIVDDTFSINKLKKTLIDNEIVLGKSGLYISFKSIFFRFMIKLGDKLHFQRGPFEWYGFKNLYNDSIYWNTLLERAVNEYAKINHVTLHQSRNHVAKKLAESEITAVNPDYIIGWWTNYEELTLDCETYNLYKIEHPFTPNDMRIIFSVVKSLCPKLVNDLQIADRSYAAAITLQNLRRNALKRKDKNVDVKYYSIYSRLERELMQIVRNAELFRVSNAHMIKVSCDVEGLKIFDEYTDYISK
ncbi:hypothetical protein [Methanolobus bombayensis]|uniref:hypothetical protein n=1 Tax=Methanolobus bombayensis TaxID=38023 RepID=UPI001AE241ED|nr:hypothetical protein [Methanolobus bombayensis]MBP1910329.1 hypothetical protein [Methanolobus bombayensis]